MKQYKEIDINGLQANQADLFVALLSEAGYTGFEESENGDQLKAFIGHEDFDGSLLNNILSPHAVAYELKDIEEENWNALWESNFEPVVVDDFVVLRADFHKQHFDTRLEIIITPKMSFGTGHHATTYMMITQMRLLDFPGKKVFDFGTGTGILSILADKLGASEILAVDNDDWSIANAAENIERNDCHHISLKKTHTAVVDQKFNIILANINKHVIIANAEILVAALLPGAVLLLSGLLREDEMEIMTLFTHLGLIHLETQQKGIWIAIRWQSKL